MTNMTDTATRVKFHVDRYADAKGKRGQWETNWEKIARVVYPRMQGGFIAKKTPGEDLRNQVFDGAAIQANLTLAAGLHGMMTNPQTDWFDVAAEDEALMAQQPVQAWFAHVREVMFREINRPAAQFVTAMHEFYKEFCAFGTGVPTLMEHPNTDGLLFETRHLAECVLIENNAGVIDTMYRKFDWTVDQLVSEFGLDNVSPGVKKKVQDHKLSELVEAMHVIEPRKETTFGKRMAANKPIESLYFEVVEKHVLRDSGFDEQPMFPSRFDKAAGEIYGRGPGHASLADTMMLQQMAKTTIKAAQKAVDPPLQVPDDAKLNPVRTVPGGINYYRSGTQDRIEPMPVASNPLLGEELMASVRMRIREMFFIDQLQIGRGPQMTATEVLERVEERLRLLGPMLGRIQSEMLGPMLERTFAILQRKGMFLPAPQILQETQEDFKFVFTSPIARAQKQLESQGLLQAMNILGLFLDRDPDMMDVFDTDFIARHVTTTLSGADPRSLRDQEEVTARRADRRRQQQEQQDAANAQQGAMAVNQLAQAAANG